MSKSFSYHEYFLVFLVDSNVRPACLFMKHEISDSLQKNIKKYFPNLILNHDPFFGLFVSKTNLSINEYSDSNDIGKILGYPNDGILFTEINRNKDYYDTHIVITMDDGQEIYILDVVTQYSIYDSMLIIKNLMSEKLLSPECFYHGNIKNIRIVEKVTHSIDYYCKKLIMKDLNDEDIFQIRNLIVNTFNEKISDYPYDFLNDLHIGIIVNLLLQCKHNQCEQFYGPSFGQCKITKKMIEINNTFSDNLIRILEFTG
jgi:hypothetical protein